MEAARTQPLTYSALIRLFLPLSLSDMILVASAPLVGAALSRLPDPSTHLAAYGASLSVALLVESPVIMLLHAATAAAANRESYRTLHRLMVWLSVATTAVMALLAWTPLYGLVFDRLLGLPPDVSAAAQPALAVLLLWPAAIAWRRYYQGWLIHRRRSQQVMWAGFGRLFALSATLAAGMTLRLPGAFIAGMALQMSVIVEGCAVRWFARGARSDETPDEPSSVPAAMGPLLNWYLPLAGTAFLVWVTRPLMTAGIARGALPVASLAAWPVVSGTYSLLANGTRMVQQLTISLGNDAATRTMLFRFALGVGAAFTGTMAVLAFTPLADLYLSTVVGPALLPVARPTLQAALLFPLLVAVQSWLQGLMVRTGKTYRINLAALFGSALSVGSILLLAPALPVAGAVLASASMTAGLAMEVGVLALVRPHSPPGGSVARPKEAVY